MRLKAAMTPTVAKKNERCPRVPVARPITSKPRNQLKRQKLLKKLPRGSSLITKNSKVQLLKQKNQEKTKSTVSLGRWMTSSRICEFAKNPKR